MKAKQFFIALAIVLFPLSCNKREQETPDYRTLEYTLGVTNDNYTATTVLDGIGDTKITEVLNQPTWVSDVTRKEELLDGSMVLYVTVKSDPALDGVRTAHLEIKMSSGATARLTISQRSGLPIGLNDDESPSVNKAFEQEWWSAQYITLVTDVYSENGRDKVFTKEMPLPWNDKDAGLQCNIPDDDIKNMLENKNVWTLAFNTTGIETSSCVNLNYFGLYNVEQGMLRVFYYWPKELLPPEGANDYLWYARFSGRQAQHNSTHFAVPLHHKMDTGTKEYEEFSRIAGTYYTTAIAKDAKDFLVVPKQGWWAFDVELTAMRDESFFKNYEPIVIGMDVFDSKNVILQSVIKDGSISGTISGDMNLNALKPASTRTDAKIWPNILSAGGSFLTNKFWLDWTWGGGAGFGGKPVQGGGGDNAVQRPRFAVGWGIISVAAGCLLQMAGNIGKDTGKEKQADASQLGHLDTRAELSLNCAMKTEGLIKSERSHTVPEVRLPIEYLKNVAPKTKSGASGVELGKGLWNISTDPVVYIVKDAYWANKAQATYYSRKELNWYRSGVNVAEYDISMSPYQLGLRLISFFDPTSIGEVVINEEAFGHPINCCVSVSYGIYPGSEAGYTDWFRTATSMDYNPLTLSTAAKDQKVSTGNVPGAVKAPFRVFKIPYNKENLQIEFNNPYPDDVATRLSEQNLNEGNYQRRYYGTSLFFCNPTADYKTVDQVQFVADPQIFVPYNEKRRVITDPDIPDMVVSVNIMFQSQAPYEDEPSWKTYTMRYIPKVEFISVNEVKGVADRIKSTANGGQPSGYNYASFDTHNAIVQQYAREISKQLAK